MTFCTVKNLNFNIMYSSNTPELTAWVKVNKDLNKIMRSDLQAQIYVT